MSEDPLERLLDSLQDWILEAATTRIAHRSWLASDIGHTFSTNPHMDANGTMLRHLAASLPQTARLLDFGCGDVPSRRLYEQLGFRWVGLDYGESIDPAYEKGKAQGSESIVYYDGLRIPFDDAEFDVVWSTRSLEHILDVEVSFSEIARVTREHGFFAGSVSFLEPYHARSTFSFSPYGFSLILRKHGFELIEIAAGIDGLSLILQRLAGIFGSTSDRERIRGLQGGLARVIAQRMEALGYGRFEIQSVLLQVCGHFRFIARRLPAAAAEEYASHDGAPVQRCR